MNLQACLEQWTSDELKKYVVLLGGSSKIARKNERIGFICQHLLAKEAVTTLWHGLDLVAQKAISAAYHNDGFFDATSFMAQYGALPPRPENDHYYFFHQEPIIFDLFVIQRRIADDVMPLLAPLVLPLEPFRLLGVEVVPADIDGDYDNIELTAVVTEVVGRADLLTYLQMVDQQQLKWSSKNKQLTAGSIRQLLKNLLDGDFRDIAVAAATGRQVIRPFGLDIFAQEAGWVTGTGKLTKAGRDYLQTQDPEQMLSAFEKWHEAGKFDELSRLQRLSGLNSRQTRLTPPAGRRTKVIEALSWCPVGVWIGLDDFYRAVLVWQFDFEVESTDYTNLYVGSRYYDELEGHNYWNIVNGLYINAVIWEYLGTIGAVDVVFASDDEVSLVQGGYNDIDEPISLYDGLAYFRINKWGAYLLGQADSYEPIEPEAEALFTIDSARRVHLVAGLAPNQRLQLELLAVMIDEMTYQLSEDILLTAVENGQSLEQLIAFLAGYHQGEMLPAVADWLATLVANQGAFEERETAVVIKLRQPELMAVIEQDAQLAKICRALDAKTVLVLTKHKTRFQKQLKALGYLYKQ